MAIGNCLFTLRTHDVETSLPSLHFSQADEGIEGQIRFLVTRLLAGLEDGIRPRDTVRRLTITKADFPALKKLYRYIMERSSLAPEEQRTPLFKLSMRIGLKDIPGSSIGPVFRLIPRESLTGDVRLALTALLQGNPERRASVARHLAAIEVSQRASMVLLAESFLGYQLGVLEQIAKLPQDELPAIISAAKNLQRESKNGHHFKAILEALLKVLPSLRSTIIGSAEPLIRDVTNGQHTAAIIEAVSKIYWKGRATIIALTVSLKEGASNGEHIAAILKAVKKLPWQERANIVALAQPLIEVTTHSLCRVAVLQAVKKLRKAECAGRLAPGETAVIIALAKLLVKGISNPNQFSALLEFIIKARQEEVAGKFPEGEVAAIAALAESLTEKIPDGNERINLLRVLKNIPKEERSAIVDLARSLMEGVPNQNHFIIILNAVAELRPEQYPMVALMLPLMEEMETGLLRAGVVHAVAKSSLETLKTLFEESLDLLKETPKDQRAALLTLFLEEPS